MAMSFKEFKRRVERGDYGDRKITVRKGGNKYEDVTEIKKTSYGVKKTTSRKYDNNQEPEVKEVQQQVQPQQVREPAQQETLSPQRVASPQQRTSAQISLYQQYQTTQQGFSYDPLSRVDEKREQTQRRISDRAYAIAEREEAVAERERRIKEKLRLSGIDIKPDDNALIQTGKTVLGGLYSATVGVATTTTFQRLTGVVDKAAFRAEVEYAEAKGYLAPEQSEALKDERKKAAAAVPQAISPVLYSKEEGLRYNPIGTGNIIFATATVGAGAYAQSKISPTPKTTGVPKGKIEVTTTTTRSGTVSGQLRSNNLPQTSTATTLKFKDTRSGLFNRLTGRTVPTTVKKMPSGTVVRTQQTGKTTYVKTIIPKGAKEAKVQFIKDGKVVKTTTTKNPRIQETDIAMFESTVKARERGAISPQQGTLYQKAKETRAFNIRGQFGKSKQIKGTIEQKSITDVKTQAGFQRTTYGEFLQSGKDVFYVPKKSIREVPVLKTAKGTPKPQPQIKSEMIGQKPGVMQVKYTQKAPLETAFSQTTVSKGTLSVSNLPLRSFGKSGQVAVSKTVTKPETIFIKPPSFGATSKTTLTFIKDSSAPSFGGVAPIGGQLIKPSSPTKPQIREPEVIPKPKDKVDIETVPDVKKQPEQQIKPISDTRPKEEVKPTTFTPQKPKEKTIGKPKQPQKPIQKPILQPPTTRQVQTPKPPTTTTPRVPRLVTPQPPQVPLIPTAGAFIPPKQKQRKETGFDVFAKVKGQFKKVNIAPLRRKEALAFGGFYVGKTASATFKVEKASGSIGQRFSGFFKRQDFYDKDDTFIQKKRKRISSLGELREITFKGQAARRRKNGIF